MALPAFAAFLRPVLSAFGDDMPHNLREVRERVAEMLGLDESDRGLFLSDNRTPVHVSRTDWAVTYLHRAGALQRVSRGVYEITGRGRSLLEHHPSQISVQDLLEFPEFRQFYVPRNDNQNGTTPPPDPRPPTERLEEAYRDSRASLAAELLDQVSRVSPRFFEQLVLDLLLAMGYGGSIEDAASAVGRAGDGGIDGIIKEDKLGLDVVYVQAKRWQQNVGRPEVQAFVGALAGKKARKGVFITTSDFTREAREYVLGLEPKIVLIDGRQLAELMIDHDVGVTTVQTYRLKRVDLDYFESD